MELSNRDELESRFAARFARLNATLRHRLEDYLGYPPDINRVPESYWQEVQDEMNRELAAVLLLIWSQSAIQHGLVADVASVVQALDYSNRRATSLAPQFAANTRDMLAAAGRRWSVDSPARGEFQGDLAGILGPSRAAGMAATETTAAQTAGGEIARRQLAGLSDLDTWFTRRDDRVCPVCQPLHLAWRAEWQAKFPSGPPAHPMCRCWIRYAPAPGEVRA
jgi:hypothetical protein